VIKELQSLYDLGYRGHIDIVDDNFIGNKKKAKDLLRELKNGLKTTIIHFILLLKPQLTWPMMMNCFS